MNILIIGAGPGLSRSVVHLFGQKGFTITLVARNAEKLQQEINVLQAAKFTANYMVADAGDNQALTIILENLKSKNNLPDVILYNAFSASQSSFEDETWESLKKQLDVNVGGAFAVLKSAIPAMIKSGRGKVFFTGGGFGIEAHPEFIGISMGKAALRNLAQAAAKKVEGTNVHISIVNVCGFIGGSDSKYAPDKIAEEYWKLYKQSQGEFEMEVVY